MWPDLLATGRESRIVPIKMMVKKPSVKIWGKASRKRDANGSEPFE
ncbi:hypothetical protein HMPREF9104_03034 [Lentilactobacillus kisonensis F0435]|uniref:Uncharacterized protein n=1 Tax=Lentilactobacillus kisonensis F0435 TaxID=797516 RepID=H1LK87_9LACO|nr:hypothetical protein HMPREF9104_03034 [Lentilactobacillus kisonensis F0435]